MNIVVVLGKVLNNDSSMSEELIDRLRLGIATYRSSDASLLCLTGGCANPLAKATEAEKMVEYCINEGIREEEILKEDKSLTTYDNAKNLRELLKNEKIEKIYLVSTKYHFFRTVFPTCQSLFKKFFKDSEIINIYEE